MRVKIYREVFVWCEALCRVCRICVVKDVKRC
nr:MAG TPA: hypothetical protein [Caudoviricetes sp.]DAT31977.1 MAG TPA: hypothetical protein [Caudoviricetes sp.]